MSNSSPPAAIPGTNGNTVNDDSGMLDPARAVLPLHPTFFFGLPTRKALVASKSHPRDEEEDDDPQMYNTHTFTHTHTQIYTHTLSSLLYTHNIHDHTHMYRATPQIPNPQYVLSIVVY